MLTVTGCGANDYQTAEQLMGSGDAAAASAAFKSARRLQGQRGARFGVRLLDRDGRLPCRRLRAGPRFSPRSATIKRALRSSPHATMRSRRTPMTPESTRTPRSLFTALGDYKNSAALAAQAGDRVFAEKLLGSWVSNEWMYRRSSSTPYTMPLMTTNPPKRFWTAWSSALFPEVHHRVHRRGYIPSGG